uniref:Epidermal patterning factor-like protein n=1 Tax=Oryza punctata TaxID=4537 RepID=A0A0E0KIH2_ORYPU
MEFLLLCSSSLLLLLISSQGLHSTEAITSAPGGELHHHQIKEPPPEVEQTAGKGWTAMSEALIGSRPPRCEGKCAPCGRCEAVQVPVAPRAGRLRLRAFFFRTVGDRVVDDDESSTNYKPLNWKCRCADTRRALDP